MRENRFIAEHRGGPLTRGHHQQLIRWACECCNHVMYLLGDKPDDRLFEALNVAHRWIQGDASVGQARKASVDAIAAANSSLNPTEIAVARAVGHAAATAHMADHCLGSALYALKAVRSAGGSVEAERHWQTDRLPLEIRDLVLSSVKYGYIESTSNTET